MFLQKIHLSISIKHYLSVAYITVSYALALLMVGLSILSNPILIMHKNFGLNYRGMYVMGYLKYFLLKVGFVSVTSPARDPLLIFKLPYIVPSVTRCWNKNSSIFLKKLPKKQTQKLLLKKCQVSKQPKCHLIFGLHL